MVCMKKILFVLVLLVGLALVSGVAYARTYELYTLSGFVESLIERGFIPNSMAGKARDLVQTIEKVEDSGTVNVPEEEQYPNSDKVTLKATQLIEHANLEYQAGTPVEGLLLVVENPTEESLVLSAVRKCQVVYRIYNAADEMLYDSSTSEVCQTDERVLWELLPGQSRMFNIAHQPSTYELAPGTYRFEIDYPGYGKGERMVTVL